ncbi:hypothetical protein FQA39_LY06986 [Lamprigera yunnana]|nr:hypothetical protein FQA39_LY06986 [Lamprigera yunnana]
MEFENYVKESTKNGELERQHQLFPRGQTKPWDYGVLPQNKAKNRYSNLIAYDHTRVKLEKIGNDEYSDYINANYIEGYNSTKAYIATQGPKPSTVNDFWRMVWQENVTHIIMVANVIEGGKKKSEQYWPNTNERVVYGNVDVENQFSQVFADYEFRSFLVKHGDEQRKIEHLHFTSWPDHGVPLYCQSLVPFLRKLLTIPQGTSPVVVHCSAGVGRTGTIILSDLCLRMAAREGFVDILKHQQSIREQRVNLVDNVEQYKLVHLVLLECLIAPQTSFQCDETIENSIKKVLTTDTLDHHIQYLKDTDWQDYVMQSQSSFELKPQWALKNRFQQIYPSGIGRVYLTRYPVNDEHSDYINAVEVDGFRAPQRFIATQQPLPHTVCDFWRMVDEKEVSTIVSLNKIETNDKTSCIFWPTEKLEEIKPVSFITLKFQNKIKKDFYSIVTINLHNTKTKKGHKRTVHLISLKSWIPDTPTPDDNNMLVRVWEEMERLTRGNENPIVVTCHDGVTACGLFLALVFLIEKIKLEQQCDLCLAVRTIRHNQKKFVTKKEQFKFLYESTLVYLSGFELYSNFNSIIKN